MSTSRTKRGFTLIEMTVSLGLFTIVMFIATSAFLSIVNADRKSRSVRIAADNLNIALEDMSRRIKTGSAYYCGAGGEALSLVHDCSTPATTLFFTGQDGQRVKYTLDNTTHALWRTVGAGAPLQTTSPEISVTSLNLFVSGSAPCGGTTPCTTNAKQPVVTIVIDGTLGSGTTSSDFKIQTTVTQRAYDNQ